MCVGQKVVPVFLVSHTLFFKAMGSSETNLSNTLLFTPDVPPEWMSFPAYRAPAEMIVNVVIVLVAILLNILLLCHLTKVKHSNLRTFLINLIVADLFICFFTAGVELGWRITVSWTAGDFGCRFFSSTKTFGIYAQSYIIVAATINHSYVTFQTYNSREQLFRCKTLHSMAWLAAFVFSIPQALVFHVEHDPLILNHAACVPLTSLSQNAKYIYATTGLLAAYFVPIIIVVAVHSAILWRLAQRRGFCQVTVLVTKPTLASATDDSLTMETDGEPSQFSVAPMKPELREAFRTYAMRLSIIILISFVVSSTPYAIVVVFNMAYSTSVVPEPDFSQLMDALLNLFLVLAALLNPLIYGIFFFHAKRSYNLAFAS